MTLSAILLLMFGFFSVVFDPFTVTPVSDSSAMKDILILNTHKLFCSPYTLSIFSSPLLMAGHAENKHLTLPPLRTTSSAEGPNINMDSPQRETRQPIELFRFDTNLLLCLSSPLAESKGGRGFAQVPSVPLAPKRGEAGTLWAWLQPPSSSKAPARLPFSPLAVPAAL